MLKLFVGLFTLQLLVATVLTEQTNKQNDSLYMKFHQSDYDIKVEWAEVVRFSKPELKQFDIHIFKYNRTCPAGNLTYTYNIDITEEFEVVIQVYKFLSNEYRHFPIRFQLNYCKQIASNIFGSSAISKCGNITTCVARKGITYHVCNWTPDQSQFPPLIPAGRYMIEMQGVFRNKEMWLARGYGAVSRSIKIE